MLWQSEKDVVPVVDSKQEVPEIAIAPPLPVAVVDVIEQEAIANAGTAEGSYV